MAFVLSVTVTSVASGQDSRPVRFPSRALELLAGPLTVAKETPWRLRYDEIQLQRGRQYATAFPQDPQDLLGSNYYDLALTLYEIYYRTNDPYWRDRARTVAKAWLGDPLNQNLAPHLRGNWNLPTPPARGLATLGIAIYALEAEDAEARRIVNLHAVAMARGIAKFDGYNADMREASYALMALLAATVLGNDHRAEAKASLESFLAGQRADGRWENIDDGRQVPARVYTLNYMSGLLLEALVLYDRVIGNPRILPAIERCLQWTWNTQWVPAAQAFQYANINSGTVNTNPYANLSGLLLPAWGYAYAKTGNRVYLEQGDQILKGIVEVGAKQIHGLKQFTQTFRSSPRYLGFRQMAPIR